MTMITKGSAVKAWLLDLIFPQYCLGCDEIGTFLCKKCEARLQVVPPSCFFCKRLVPEKNRITTGRTCKGCQDKTAIYAFLSPFLFKDAVIRDLVYQLKYSSVRDISRVLGRLLADYCDGFRIKLPKDLVVMSIPLYRARRRVRGFNQAELIARAWIENTRLIPAASLLPDALERIRDTKSQVGLLREERTKNVSGVFRVRRPEAVKGKDVLLVDDVKTTGATLEEAAGALKDAGARRVWALTVAH